YSQRDIKWNRQRILDQKHVNIELLDEFIQMAFEKLSQFVDSIRQLARADAIRESHVVCFQNRRVFKMRFRNNIAHFLRAVAQTRKIKTLMIKPLQHMRPLFRLERNTVGAVEASRDKADVQIGCGDGISSGHLYL